MDMTGEMRLFQRVIQLGSLTAVAREAGCTTASISKRLQGLEQRLGVRLLNRTTRRLSLTDEGELYSRLSAKILSDMADLEQVVSLRRATPKGLLRVNATFGFGRKHIAPAVLEFVQRHREMEIQLQLTERPIAIEAEGFDIDIRVGEVTDSHLIARRIAPNERIVCAAPGYLKAHGAPRTASDLRQHDCIVLRDNDAAFGVWKFTGPRGAESIKVRGRLSSNDGEIVHAWALAGHGIMLRSSWDVADDLRSGALVRLLPQYRPGEAGIHAVYSPRSRDSARVRLFVEFLVERFAAPVPWLVTAPMAAGKKKRAARPGQPAK